MCMRVHRCLQTLEVSDHSGTGVTGGCELPNDGLWKPILGFLEEQWDVGCLGSREMSERSPFTAVCALNH